MAPRLPRDSSYFEHLSRLIELEHRAQKAELAQLRKTLPLAELESRGLVVLDVEVSEESVGLGGRSLVTLKRADSRPLRTGLGPGDIVSLAPRKAAIDAPPTGMVTQVRRTGLQLAFERPPPEWAREGRLRVDVVANDVTIERLRRGLEKVKAMKSGQAFERQQLILGSRPPRFEERVAWEPSRPLNPEQRAAVELCLKARDVALVHGPPGTGKSTVLGEVALQCVRRGQRVLCTAASNAAVDHLLEVALEAGLNAVRVGHPGRVLPHLQQHTVDLLVEDREERQAARELFDEGFELLGYARRQRSQGRSRERFANAREAKTDAYALFDEARRLERQAVSAVLGQAQVVCATLTMLDGTLLESQRFDVALVDEATQAVEPATLLAFLKAPTVVLAGDPHQLSATVTSTEAVKGGLGVSLFERLLSDYGEEVKQLLKEQHRMHAQIMEFPSKRVYGGALRAHEAAAGRVLAPLLSRAIEAPPVLFIDTAGKGFFERQLEGSESLVNDGEAELIVARARALLGAGLKPSELAVITPYRAQAQVLREALADQPEVEVDTVDAFQGREKEAVLVSLVRANEEQQVGFLADVRRMNVAMTRARRHLFVVGDSATLTGHKFYEALIEHAQAQGQYRSAWEWSEEAG